MQGFPNSGMGLSQPANQQVVSYDFDQGAVPGPTQVRGDFVMNPGPDRVAHLHSLEDIFTRNQTPVQPRSGFQDFVNRDRNGFGQGGVNGNSDGFGQGTVNRNTNGFGQTTSYRYPQGFGQTDIYSNNFGHGGINSNGYSQTNGYGQTNGYSHPNGFGQGGDNSNSFGQGGINSNGYDHGGYGGYGGHGGHGSVNPNDFGQRTSYRFPNGVGQTDVYSTNDLGHGGINSNGYSQNNGYHQPDGFGQGGDNSNGFGQGGINSNGYGHGGYGGHGGVNSNGFVQGDQAPHIKVEVSGDSSESVGNWQPGPMAAPAAVNNQFIPDPMLQSQPGQYPTGGMNIRGFNGNIGRVTPAAPPALSMMAPQAMMHSVGAPMAGNGGGFAGPRGGSTFDTNGSRMRLAQGFAQDQTINPSQLAAASGSSSSLGSNSSTPFDNENTPGISDNSSISNATGFYPEHDMDLDEDDYEEYDDNDDGGVDNDIPAIGLSASANPDWDVIPKEDIPTYMAMCPIPGPHSGHRRCRDGYMHRMHHIFKVSYSNIRSAFASVGWTGAESTLRGRYRMMNKPPHLRPRRPIWRACHMHSLVKAVRREARLAGKTRVDKNTKIRWKRVSDRVKRDTGYEFSAWPCKKQWLKLINEFRFLSVIR